MLKLNVNISNLNNYSRINKEEHLKKTLKPITQVVVKSSKY